MIHFSTFKRVTDAKHGILHKLSVEECLEKFFKRHIIQDNKDGPGFTLNHYINITIDEAGRERVHRLGANIIGTYGIGFDIDNEDGFPIYTMDKVASAFTGYTYVIYTTHSHLIDARYPRFRIVLFFDRMLPKDKFNDIWEYFRAKLPTDMNVDKSGRDISHNWYKPACSAKMTEVASIKRQIGSLINIEKILKQTDLAGDGKAFSSMNFSTDQRITNTLHKETTPARSTSVYNTQNENVKQKNTLLINNSSNNNSLTNLTDSLTGDNEIYQRIVRVLSEPEMHVSNFTGSGYSDWISIGCAIKGAGLPFEVFDDWSARDSDKYSGRAELHKRWEGFNGTAKEGTIFKMAEERGVAHYLGIVAERKILSLPSTTIKEPEPLTEEESEEFQPRAKDDKLRDFPIELCDSAPENIRIFMDYVLETNTFPNPVFALASSISVMGTLYHQRIEAEYMQCCTNMYILSLALSGQGKSHAFKCINNLFTELNLIDKIRNVPASTTGLITALRAAEGNMYLNIDEIEKKLLGKMVSKQSGAHYLGIAGELMNLYSIPNNPYITNNMYADDEKNKKQFPIPNPHLSIYGACVNDDFYRHYSGELAEDGFLARIIPFANKEYFPTQNIEHKDIRIIPHKLLILCRNILKDPIIKLGSDLDMRIRPKIIKFDSEKTKRFHAGCVEDLRHKAFKLSQDGRNKEASLYNRICENALKISLAAHEGGVISRPIWEWSFEVASATTHIVINNAIVGKAHNIFESKVHQLEQILVKNVGWMSISDIANKFRHPSKERNDLLEYLVETGKILYRKTKPTAEAKRGIIEYMAI